MLYSLRPAGLLAFFALAGLGVAWREDTDNAPSGVAVAVVRKTVSSASALVQGGSWSNGTANSGVRWTFESFWNPSRSAVKDTDDCDTAQEVLATLLDQERHFEVLLGVALFFAANTALVACGFLLGSYTKPRPPRYWSQRPRSPFTDNFDAEVDVTKELGDAVQRLLNITTLKDAMGVGKDGKWATHKGFKVIRVTRVENGKLWSAYARARNAIQPVKMTMQKMILSWLKVTEDAVQTIEAVHSVRDKDPAVAAFIASLGLDATRNERILFHGSPSAGARTDTGAVLFPSDDTSPAFAIKKAGFDERLGSVKGMYGAGTYFSDMASKADQYSGKYNPPGLPQGSVGEWAVLFLSRVTLGCPYLTRQSLEQLRRPPCIEGHFDLNLSFNSEAMLGRPWREKGVPFRICDHCRFDSVMGDLNVDGQRKLFREFVVYGKQAYPEFCVVYERIA